MSSREENTPTSTPTPDLHDRLRSLPSVSEMLERLRARGWFDRLPHNVIAQRIRSTLDTVRKQIVRDDRTASTIDSNAIEMQIEMRLARDLRPPLASGINATGIILHTGLGRAPVAREAVNLLAEVASGYAPVELDLESGKRSRRTQLVRSLLSEITGAESATVVNNNAAAMMLTLASLAENREVIVSRGELVEIGGSFRLPDVIQSGGAILREVGTTNKTRLTDYERAITGNTAAILKVHTSNFRIDGFTRDVSIDELASLGRARLLPVVHDIGSGLLVEACEYGLHVHEPNARDSIARGADLVMFSGDKLLGASQAGIIVGKATIIDRIERHPMMRAMRVDKMTLAVLGRILQIHRDPAGAARVIPALRMATDSIEVVRARAQALSHRLADSGDDIGVRIESSTAYLGGGSVPGQEIESRAVVIDPSPHSAEGLAAQLRAGLPSVIARIADEHVRFDCRTIFDEQIEILATAIRSALLALQTL